MILCISWRDWEKLEVTTCVPYIYQYWNKKQLLHLVAFIFNYGLQLITL